MTPLEERVRQALADKGGEFPPDAVPQLRLPARRRRLFSLAYGGGERKQAPAARGWLAPVAAAVAVAAIAGSAAIYHVVSQQARADSYLDAAADRGMAASWVAAQVSHSERVFCDPVTCRMLVSRGFPVADLDEMWPGATHVSAPGVIVTTPAVRAELGSHLNSEYAPGIIASFGTGASQVDVRVIDLRGAAAYKAAVSEDLRSRKSSGTVLARSTSITAPPIVRRQLMAGQVDTRVLVTMAGLGAQHRLSVIAFGDSGPGAGAASPLRSVEFAWSTRATGARRPGSLREMWAFLKKQSAEYRPARVTVVHLPDGRAVVRIEFAAPSPLGLLDS